MKKIDRETVQKILDTADIVDVVSDFVHLKRRGAGYIGLCPFPQLKHLHIPFDFDTEKEGVRSL